MPVVVHVVLKDYAFLSQGYTHDEFQQQNSGGKLPTTLAVTTIGNYDLSEYCLLANSNFPGHDFNV